MAEERRTAGVAGAIIAALVGAVGAYVAVAVTGFVWTPAEFACHLWRPSPVGNGITILVSTHPDSLFNVNDFNLWFRPSIVTKDLQGIRIAPTCTRPNASAEEWNDEMEHENAAAAAWGTYGDNLYIQLAGSDDYDLHEHESHAAILHDISLLTVRQGSPVASPKTSRDKGATQAIFDGMLSRDAQQRHSSRQQAIALGADAVPDLISWARAQKNKTYDLALGTAYVISSLVRKGQSDALKQVLSDDDKKFLRSLQSVSDDPTLQQQIAGLRSLLE